MSEPDPLPAGFRLDRYLIQSELALAGMGRVYTATDTALNEVVAINVLAPSLRDADGLARFRLCFGRAVKKVRSAVHDYGEWQGIPYAVLPYSEGSPVFDISTLTRL